MSEPNYRALVNVIVDVLKEQLEDDTMTFTEKTNPWQTLNNIVTFADVYDVPLSEIGLEGYNPDDLLNKTS